MRISVILPFLNEAGMLEECLDTVATGVQGPGEWEVLLSDSGSTDASLGIADQWAQAHGHRMVRWTGGEPSVGRAVSAAARLARGEILWVLPVDCHAPPAAWSQLQQSVSTGTRCGAFPKRYVPSSLLLRPYAWAQNRIRLRASRQAVWTNGLFFPRSQPIPTLGFLEDVLLSDAIRRRPDWAALPTPILVSSRRYYPNRTLRRIWINAGILTAYRLFGVSPLTLKKWYLGKG